VPICGLELKIHSLASIIISLVGTIIVFKGEDLMVDPVVETKGNILAGSVNLSRHMTLV
jgi:hypothetical protein